MKRRAFSLKSSDFDRASYPNFSKNELKSIEQAKKLLEPLATKYNLQPEFLLKENSVPVSIFLKELTPLESIVKYLKEEKNFSFSVISKIIKRNERNVWHIYDNARKKYTERLKIDNLHLIPLHIFSNEKLSALDVLVL